LSIEPVGLLTLIVGIICLLLGHRATAATLIVATLLGAAAAVLIGAANIPPAHLLLAFLAITILTRRPETARAIRAMNFPGPAFWLLCLVIYGLISGFAMPRLLSGSMLIFPLGTSEYASTGSTVPLGPVSGNLTQGIYLVGDLICFVLIIAIASTQAGFNSIASALVAYAAGNVIFAFVDLGTYATGTQWMLEFMRNATYTLHIDEDVGGLKRIVGSFTEASAFAGSTLGALGFTGTLWICGRRPALTGSLALVSLVLVALSTSSTGLAGTPPLLLILYVTALMRRGVDFRRPFASMAVLGAPLLVVAMILAVELNQDLSKPIHDYMNTLIFSKSTSDSAIERGSWNTSALSNFFDSYGLGVGLGTARASSFPLALLSNVGVPGTIFYLLFAASAFLRRRGTPCTFNSDVRLAARNSCLSLVIGGIFAGTTVDQGLLFCVLAGLACAEPEREILSNQPAGART
jgi:hypothetical protein